MLKLLYCAFRDKVLNDQEFRNAFIKHSLDYLKTTVMRSATTNIDENHIDDLISNPDLFKVN